MRLIHWNTCFIGALMMFSGCRTARNDMAQETRSPDDIAEARRYVAESLTAVQSSLDVLDDLSNVGGPWPPDLVNQFTISLAHLEADSFKLREHARAMHQRVLHALVEHGADLTQLVHHAALANNADAVLEFAPLAGKEASRLGAHREAAAHFGAALRYSASLAGASQAELFELHARECSFSNQTTAAIASGTQAVALWRQVGDVEAQDRGRWRDRSRTTLIADSAYEYQN